MDEGVRGGRVRAEGMRGGMGSIDVGYQSLVSAGGKVGGNPS